MVEFAYPESDSLAYVYDYWPKLKDRYNTELYTLRQLTKKFTPAEIIAVPEPYVPVVSAPVQTYAVTTTPSPSTPEYVPPEDSSLVTWLSPSVATAQTQQAQQEPIQAGFLSGLPTWAIALVAVAGLGMFISKGKKLGKK